MLHCSPYGRADRAQNEAMPTLVLIRHAKAETGRIDIERELAPRGRRDAITIGAYLAALDLKPDRVLVSPAARAGQTWAEASTALTGIADPQVDERIYDNTTQSLLSAIRDSGEAQTLVLVGHNPSMETLALLLSSKSADPEAMAELAAGYATSGVAVFDVAGGFAETTPSTARLVRFHVARAI
jgi:phosphohistidine phosphatase